MRLAFLCSSQVAILMVGTVSLVEAFLLGVSVRLRGPWLPR
jgi:hypothetical protein